MSGATDAMTWRFLAFDALTIPGALRRAAAQGFDNERGKGELSVRELARAVGRDVKRVHEDVVILAGLGLLERTEGGGVVCPYSSMHIDMYLKAA
ncbi:MAG: hypothetical protein A3E79_01825 [Burkholderiales bacterium RIFCSPHIGHO2_12_FULL_61_11]|nr:MAG: hypothetical protein A3E79_01825 [Burkholderiales bacterium RIFCSPHIGHO2_12_FULL_61_11]